MGSSNWSDTSYRARAATRAATGAPVFAYHAAVASGDAPMGVHTSLDPKRAAGKSSALAGQNIREARDSADHPVSNAVAVFMDVTGSMQKVPQLLQASLVSLMGLLLRKSYLTDPAILIGGVGDATCDRVPMQIGQFEAGIEIENDLTNLYLEGGGGGQLTESYELAFYFLARKTALDCFEKRGKKGMAFIIGDEMAYQRVDRKKVLEIFGDTLEADLSLTDIVREAQEKFEVFYILPRLTSHYDDPRVETFWRELLGQNFIKLDDPKGISELIATLIGTQEGTIVSVEEDLKEVGTDITIRNAVNSAITPLTRSKGEIANLAGTGLSGF